MRSKSALVKAVDRVTRVNKGKSAPGIDGFKATNDKARGELVDMLRSSNMKFHRPKPAFRKYIPKKNGKKRSLGIPTIKDRVYQEIIRMAMEPEWEAKFELQAMVSAQAEDNMMLLEESIIILKAVSGVG